jgi:sigma-B regulation protein RsbU (phosphoserine phosphatase)
MLPEGYRTKHLEYSTQHLVYHGQEMIIVIVHDVTELENQRAALADRASRLEEDLRSAAVIQQAMLPRPCAFRDGARFAYSFQPSQHVGGDIFDVFELPGNRVGMYMLDVAGHGAPAAMLSVCVHQRMLPASGLVADLSRDPPRVLPPELALEALDAEFPFSRFETHFTICYCVLDVETGRLECSNAAHPKPVVVSPDGETTVLEESGCIIGLGCIVPFGTNQAVLSPGSRLVMATDGILEHGPDSSRLFGFDRYLEALRANAALGLGSLLEAVMAEARGFAPEAPVRDDMTLFGLEYGDEG